DEYRYHESLVHPAMAGRHERVLVLGGGDGLALREILRYDGARDITLVELDPAVLDLARHHDSVRELNGDAFADERVDAVAADAFGWVRDQVNADAQPYDVVVIDMPDPDSTATSKLYSLEFYGMVHDLVADGGRMVVQAGSPFFAPRSFASVRETVEAAGFGARPYMVSVPSFGDWGFVLADPEGRVPPLRLPDDAPDLRYLSADVLEAAAVIPPDKVVTDAEVSTMLDPVILEYTRSEWRQWGAAACSADGRDWSVERVAVDVDRDPAPRLGVRADVLIGALVVGPLVIGGGRPAGQRGVVVPAGHPHRVGTG